MTSNDSKTKMKLFYNSKPFESNDFLHLTVAKFPLSQFIEKNSYLAIDLDYPSLGFFGTVPPPPFIYPALAGRLGTTGSTTNISTQMTRKCREAKICFPCLIFARTATAAVQTSPSTPVKLVVRK